MFGCLSAVNYARASFNRNNRLEETRNRAPTTSTSTWIWGGFFHAKQIKNLRVIKRYRHERVVKKKKCEKG